MRGSLRNLWRSLRLNKDRGGGWWWGKEMSGETEAELRGLWGGVWRHRGCWGRSGGVEEPQRNLLRTVRLSVDRGGRWWWGKETSGETEAALGGVWSSQGH